MSGDRKYYMAKTQIIAKAVLFAIGINAVNYLYRYSLTMSLSQIKPLFGGVLVYLVKVWCGLVAVFLF